MGGRYANTSNGVWLSGLADGEFVSFETEMLGDVVKREAVKAHICATTVQEADGLHG